MEPFFERAECFFERIECFASRTEGSLSETQPALLEAAQALRNSADTKEAFLRIGVPRPPQEPLANEAPKTVQGTPTHEGHPKASKTEQDTPVYQESGIMSRCETHTKSKAHKSISVIEFTVKRFPRN